MPRTSAFARPRTFLALATALAVVAALLALPAEASAKEDEPTFRAQVAEDVAQDRLVVTWKKNASSNAAEAARRSVGAQRSAEVRQLGIEILEVEPAERDAAFETLSRNPHVDSVEVDPLVTTAVTPNDPLWSQQWSPALTRAPGAWGLTEGSSSVVVAVLDTGVNTSHPDLQGAFVPGRNILQDNNDVTDRHGHGTLVAGVIAARGNNEVGVAGYCWRCSIMPVKVLSDDGRGSTSGVAQGIVWAVDNGADAINLSLGGSSGTTALRSAVQYAADRGVFLVAAAGNSGSDSPVYPAAYPEVIGVAGSTQSDVRYSWSNYGSWVDVAAPGCNLSTKNDGTFGSICGTSSASPVVAGIVGLAMSHRSTASAERIRAAVQQTSVGVGSFVEHGRVRAEHTLISLSERWCSGGTPVSGDWDGDGKSTPGCFRDGDWTLLHSDGSLTRFTYGQRPGDMPVVGDWNGNGRDGVGIYRPRRGGEWHLRNSLSSAGGQTAHRFVYGRQGGDVPVVGDWDGNGRDGVGIFRPSRGGEWHLRNRFSGATDHVFIYGRQRGDVPVVGDWDGNGRDRVGIFRPSRRGEWHVRNRFTGATDHVFRYGRQSGDVPIAGDWDGNGHDVAGIFREGEWHLRSSATRTGSTSQVLEFG